MTVRSILLILLAAVLSLSAADDEMQLFVTVIRHGDSIVATLAPKAGRLIIFDGVSDTRDISPGESLELRDGASLSLVRHHEKYDITCHIAPPPAGLQIDTTFDARSFGGPVTKKSYFIKTQ